MHMSDKNPLKIIGIWKYFESGRDCNDEFMTTHADFFSILSGSHIPNSGVRLLKYHIYQGPVPVGIAIGIDAKNSLPGCCAAYRV